MVLDHLKSNPNDLSEVSKDMEALVEVCTDILIRAAMFSHTDKLILLKKLNKILGKSN